MIGSLMYLTFSRLDIMFACKKQTVVATSSIEVEYVAAASYCGQVLWIQNQMSISYSILVYCWMNAVSCELLLYSVSSVTRFPMLRVVQLLVHAVDLVAAGSCTIPTGRCIIPTGSYSFMLWTWFLLVVVLFLLFLVHTVGLVHIGRYVVPAAYVWSHIRYALTHRPRIMFDSLVKQFWATVSVHNHEAGPSQIITTINGNETTDPSPRPTFDFTAKLFSNMKLNWDGPHMPLLAPMLVVPAARDGADASSPVRELSLVREPTFVREPTSVREPTPVREPKPVKEPTPHPVREPTPDSPRPPSPPPRSEEVGPTTSTRPLI
nr:hypothetical protein [Tanacetum cinerariifolium]